MGAVTAAVNRGGLVGGTCGVASEQSFSVRSKVLGAAHFYAQIFMVV